MASLLNDCGETGQQYGEIDHVVQYACQAWAKRSGGAGTRDPTLKPQNVRLTVGLEGELLHGPPAVEEPGGAVEHPATGGAPGGSSSSSGSLRRAAISSRSTAGAGRRRSVGDLTEVFQVEDFILLESPTLASLHWRNGGGADLGPIRRSAELFPAVVVLLKLRWLVRLHRVLVALGGPQCSLRRLLSGLVIDTCAVHAHPHQPGQMFEVMVQALVGRLRQAWPLFLAFVSTYAAEEDGSPRRGDEAFASPQTSASQEGGADAASLLRVVDDVFVAWLTQQDGPLVPGTLVMEELRFFGVALPLVQTELANLRAWQATKDVCGSRDRQQRPAQLQAHHLALLLELPSMRESWELSLEETLELARNVVAHPKTFNKALCTRIAWILEGAVTTTGAVHTFLAQDLDAEQLSLFRACAAGVRDCGRIQPLAVDRLRDASPPRLVGQAPRFRDGPKVLTQ